jgi:hypothetical protein
MWYQLGPIVSNTTDLRYPAIPRSLAGAWGQVAASAGGLPHSLYYVPTVFLGEGLQAQHSRLQAPTCVCCVQVRSSSLLSLDDALYRPSHLHTRFRTLYWPLDLASRGGVVWLAQVKFFDEHGISLQAARCPCFVRRCDALQCHG